MNNSLNNIALVIFSKTPGYSPVKTRLAESIGSDQAEEFFSKSLEVSIELINQIKGIDLIMALAEKDIPDHPLWRGLTCMYQGEGSLAEKLSHVYDEVLKDYQSVIFMGGDSPHLPKRLIEEAKSSVKEKFVLGKTKDGGFYLFAGSKPLSLGDWNQVTYSSEQTYGQLKDQLEKKAEVHQLEQSFDVDVLDDFKNFEEVIRSELLPSQCDLMDWALKKFLKNK